MFDVTRACGKISQLSLIIALACVVFDTSICRADNGREPLYTLFSPDDEAFCYIQNNDVDSGPCRIVRFWRRLDGYGEGEEQILTPSLLFEGREMSWKRWVIDRDVWLRLFMSLRTNAIWQATSQNVMSNDNEKAALDASTVSFALFEQGRVKTASGRRTTIDPEEPDGSFSLGLIRVFHSMVPEQWSDKMPDGVIRASWMILVDGGNGGRVLFSTNLVAKVRHEGVLGASAGKKKSENDGERK